MPLMPQIAVSCVARVKVSSKELMVALINLIGLALEDLTNHEQPDCKFFKKKLDR